MIKDREGNPTDLLCRVCGEVIRLPQYIPDNYKGELLCQNQKCKSLLHIKLVDSQLVEYKALEDRRKGSEIATMLEEQSAKMMAIPDEKSRGKGEFERETGSGCPPS